MKHAAANSASASRTLPASSPGCGLLRNLRHAPATAVPWPFAPASDSRNVLASIKGASDSWADVSGARVASGVGSGGCVVGSLTRSEDRDEAPVALSSPPMWWARRVVVPSDMDSPSRRAAAPPQRNQEPDKRIVVWAGIGSAMPAWARRFRSPTARSLAACRVGQMCSPRRCDLPVGRAE